MLKMLRTPPTHHITSSTESMWDVLITPREVRPLIFVNEGGTNLPNGIAPYGAQALLLIPNDA